MFFAKAKRFLLWCAVGLFAVSCSSFSKHSSQANNYLQLGEYDKAIEVLKPLAEKESDDQLVYLLDYGMVLHLAGRYQESIKVFSKADDIAAIKDYHSISRIAGSILLNEGMVQYKGDDFEKVFIHVYLALDYLMLNNLDDALVEARRVNNILQKYRDEAKRDYEQNGFANYLSGAMWEADRRWDDAYISYKDAYKQLGDKKILHKDLIRSSRLASRSDDFEKWVSKFKDVPKEEGQRHLHDKDAEVVFIYQQGKGPIKEPNPDFPRIPKLFPQGTDAAKARLYINGKSYGDTEPLYSLTSVAIKTLDDQYAGLIAKRAAGIAAKYVVSDQIAKKNELLGFLSWLGLNAIDQADLRQWSNLPEAFQIARVWVPAGEYEVSAVSVNGRGDVLSEKMQPKKIKLHEKQKAFLTWRSFR